MVYPYGGSTHVLRRKDSSFCSGRSEARGTPFSLLRAKKGVMTIGADSSPAPVQDRTESSTSGMPWPEPRFNYREACHRPSHQPPLAQVSRPYRKTVTWEEALTAVTGSTKSKREHAGGCRTSTSWNPWLIAACIVRHFLRATRLRMSAKDTGHQRRACSNLTGRGRSISPKAQSALDRKRARIFPFGRL